jgi:hypothetical protein
LLTFQARALTKFETSSPPNFRDLTFPKTRHPRDRADSRSLQALTLYNLGYSLNETAKRLKSKSGRAVSP